MRKLLIYTALAGSLAAASPANASHLIDIIDAPVEQITITKTFVATGPTTLVVIGGYQVPSFWQAFSPQVTALGNTTNLLKPTWAFQPAPVGSMADQAIDPAHHIVGLEFGGTYVGSYDLFWQNISTMAGQTYSMTFLYTQDFGGANGAKVTVDETLAQVMAESATPEPSTWMMMLAGFGLIGSAIRRKRDALKTRLRHA